MLVFDGIGPGIVHIATEDNEIVCIPFGDGKNVVSLLGEAAPAVTIPGRVCFTWAWN